jgi:hypothetical protein
VKNKGGGKGSKGSESSKKTVGAGGRGQSDRVKGKTGMYSVFLLSYSPTDEITPPTQETS